MDLPAVSQEDNGDWIGEKQTNPSMAKTSPSPNYAVLKVLFCCSFSEKNWMANFCLVLNFYNNECVLVCLCAYVHDGVKNVKDGASVYIFGLVTPALMEEEE